MTPPQTPWQKAAFLHQTRGARSFHVPELEELIKTACEEHALAEKAKLEPLLLACERLLQVGNIVLGGKTGLEILRERVVEARSVHPTKEVRPCPYVVSDKDGTSYCRLNGPAEKMQHDGDCTIYSSLMNRHPEDGICTCGYGWQFVRKGNWSKMYSDERKAQLDPTPPQGARRMKSRFVRFLVLGTGFILPCLTWSRNVGAGQAW